MAATLNSVSPDLTRQIHQVQLLTIAWMAVEAAVSLGAAWSARSPALLGFGGDSAIELLSAGLVLWRFRTRQQSHHAESLAAKIAGALLYVLALFVCATSILSLRGHVQPRPTLIGIAMLILAALVMPLLARRKRRLSAATKSAALRADAAESALCAYLALIALAGLAANFFLRIAWADPLAALLLVPLIVYEGTEAIKGKPCCD